MVSVIRGNSALARTTSPKLGELFKQYSAANANHLDEHNALRHRVCQQRMNSHAFKLTLNRSGQEAKVGLANPNSASFIKYYNTEQNKEKYECMLEVLGAQGLGWEGEGFAVDELDITRQWLRSRANSIEGGTSEIQLNVIAKIILGLPD